MRHEQQRTESARGEAAQGEGAGAEHLRIDVESIGPVGAHGGERGGVAAVPLLQRRGALEAGAPPPGISAHRRLIFTLDAERGRRRAVGDGAAPRWQTRAGSVAGTKCAHCDGYFSVKSSSHGHCKNNKTRLPHLCHVSRRQSAERMSLSSA